MPLGVALVHEDTVFREFGPVSGSTVRLAYDASPKMGDLLSYQTVDLDARKYLRIGTSGLFALRFKGFKSWGRTPDFFYFGGNSELRGYDYLSFVGQQGFFANAELRFPLIEAMLTPIGVLGGIRGTIFGNIGGAGVPAGELQVLVERHHHRARRSSASSHGPDGVTIVPIYGDAADGVGLPPAGRPRVLRHRHPELPARLPAAHRLRLADDVQQGLGRPDLLGLRREQGVPHGQVPLLDRLRLLVSAARAAGLPAARGRS